MTATQSKTITLDFVKGEIAGINGKAYDNKVAAIQDLEALAAPYAIGRDMHIGDTIIGIKGRVGFEAAAPMLIIAAHKMLEKHTLTKWQQYWKESSRHVVWNVFTRSSIPRTSHARYRGFSR